VSDPIRKVQSGTKRQYAAHRLGDQIDRAIDVLNDEPVEVTQASHVRVARKPDAVPSEEHSLCRMSKPVANGFQKAGSPPAPGRNSSRSAC
jgi:hypothetical protein